MPFLSPSNELLLPVDTVAPVPTLSQALERLSQCEQELKALRAGQDEWLHALSHDLRAPLRHVLSFGPLVSELLRDADMPSDMRAEALEFLQTMDLSARRMAAMLEALLELARTARMPLRWQPVALQDLLETARAQALAEAGGQDRQIIWQIAPYWPTARADVALLQQALREMLSNALKFTRHVPVAHITVAVESDADGGICLSVSDNGVGFEPSRAAGLFSVFQRMHRDAEFDGMGVGLARLRAIARRHGGEAEISAAPGQGCCVRLRWPAGVVRAGADGAAQ